MKKLICLLLIPALMLISCAGQAPIVAQDPSAPALTQEQKNAKIESDFDSFLKRSKKSFVLASQLILRFAQSGQDLKDKAALLSSLGSLFQTLRNGTVVTPEGLQTAFNGWLDTSKTHWATIGGLVVSSYTAIYAWLQPYVPTNLDLVLRLTDKALVFLAELSWETAQPFL